MSHEKNIKLLIILMAPAYMLVLFSCSSKMNNYASDYAKTGFDIF